MAREGKQRPYYEDEERYYDREPDRENRDRLERYFSRHGEEPARGYREEERPSRADERYREEEERGGQMPGRGHKPDWQRETFERGYGEHSEREHREDRYGARQERWRGNMPERAGEEYQRWFRPDYDWEREDFERAKREQRGREGYARERYGAESERSRQYRPERDSEVWSAIRERPRRPEDWRMRGPYTGRGPKAYKRPDDRIYEDVCERLMHNGEIDASNIEVEVRDGIVTLQGYVSDRQSKYAAEDSSESVFGVKDVRNELRIESSSPAWTPREPRQEARRDMIDRISRLMEVFDRNGTSIGQVKEVREADFLIERRMQRDIYVPFEAIDRVGNEVTLTVEEDRIGDMGWRKPEWAAMSR